MSTPPDAEDLLWPSYAGPDDLADIEAHHGTPVVTVIVESSADPDDVTAQLNQFTVTWRMKAAP